MMDIMSWDKLGIDVRKRRRELGLTQPDVQERGGPSVATQRAIENDRVGRLSTRMRRALEDALEWEPGSIDAVLAGGSPAPAKLAAEAASTDHSERFSLAKQVVALKATFAKHADGVGPDAREALVAEITRSAREAEESLIKVMPWLDDTDRGEAIELLVQLRAEL